MQLLILHTIEKQFDSTHSRYAYPKPTLNLYVPSNMHDIGIYKLLKAHNVDMITIANFHNG